MSKELCGFCGGRGKRPMLPPGVNAFRLRIHNMSQRMVDSLCLNCNGTGKKPLRSLVAAQAKE